LRSVQRSDRFLSIFIAGHFHKAETARASSIAVRHNADPVHLSERFKHLPQFVFRCVEAQISYKNILQASSSALSCRSASKAADWQVGDTFLKIETGAGGSRMRPEV
jgi:lysozyme family protein